jgi:hypothetical protein
MHVNLPAAVTTGAIVVSDNGQRMSPGEIETEHLSSPRDCRSRGVRFPTASAASPPAPSSSFIEQLVARPPLTMKMLIWETVACRGFRSSAVRQTLKSPRAAPPLK